MPGAGRCGDRESWDVGCSEGLLLGAAREPEILVTAHSGGREMGPHPRQPGPLLADSDRILRWRVLRKKRGGGITR